LVGVSNHPNWIIFSRPSTKENNSLQVVSYINIRLSSLCFYLHKDIFNHRDIPLISFFNDNSILFLMNIYSDSAQLALKYLKDTEVIINNILIMMGDFNIHDNFGILTVLIILPIAIYLLTLQIPYILVYCFLLTMFLLGTQTTIMTQNWSLIKCSSDMDQKNSTTTLFILNRDLFPIMLLL